VSFDALGLCGPLQKAVERAGWITPTSVQQQAIPPLLAGSDVMASARTGTGKTGAFLLPALQRLHLEPRSAPEQGCRVLVLTPTRELAEQIDAETEVLASRLALSHGAVFGGVNHRWQVRMLGRGLQVLTATPGRLFDLVDHRRARLDAVDLVVLDEADRMLDLGFLGDADRVLRSVPSTCQRALFSATLPAEVRALAQRILRDPVVIDDNPDADTAERLEQVVYHVLSRDKQALLEAILEARRPARTLVFAATRERVERYAHGLREHGFAAAPLHGKRTQAKRASVLEAFKSGSLKVLVATDLAGRGLDVPRVDLVVNLDMPRTAEDYVHRVGRTARAGEAGVAMSFCDPREQPRKRAIEKHLAQRLAVDKDHRWHLEARTPPKKDSKAGGQRKVRKR